ncbi:SusC/RagA family TonB-linked outer membrane protein [Pedobacter antarcticus]|uniref:SusC/RagA family TonB-linked outer membrane protein n=1 Tax=Pedobacter antarcticus TaxID=34086 RepID=UPI002930A06E|nr:SusC/RagA family TonB-linked outer membrane protein [Pedobacter antarcticus]
MYRFYRKDPVVPLRNRIIRRLIRGINFTTVLLITFIVQVSANSFAQKISLSAHNKPLVQVIKEIRLQTGLDFMLTAGAIRNARPVTINVKNMELSGVLKQISAGQPLDFTFEDKSIIISLRNENPRSAVLNKDIIVSGKVVDEKGNGLPGATIKLKGSESKIAITTSGDGNFSVNVPGENAVLIVSYIGYQTKEVTVSGADVNLVIKLEEASGELKGVTVVSTGYQDLPKERATGSFEKVDNALLNRSTGVNILSRLENVTPGLLIDRRQNSTRAPGLGQVTIRGLSTLTQSMASPLLILDNFPYEGDLNNINPNDVESVTILKDAAAASIWGARAANGVIVITTKKGQYNKAASVSFTSNVTIQDKPDLFKLKTMSSNDYIDLEKFLFNKGFYDNKIKSSSRPYLSPVVELLLQARQPGGTISQTEADKQIDAFRNQDVRRDYMKYIYRSSIAQQYALNINGGTNQFTYQLSGGYDKNQYNVVKNNGDRLTLRTGFTYKPIKKLEFELQSMYSQNSNNSIGRYSNILYSPLGTLPYTRLADDNGDPLIVGKDISARFLSTADSRYLDWNYRPLAELDASSSQIRSYDWLVNTGIKYQISDVFSASVRYQYTRTLSNTKYLEGQESYYTRNQINLLTKFNGDQTIRNLPIGGILGQDNGNGSSYNIRGQVNANKKWGSLHQLDALIGAEQSQKIDQYNSSIVYGYNDLLLTHADVDNITQFISPVSSFVSMPSGISFSDLRYRFISYFANAAYTYNQRYTLSASARKDEANLFGVATNLRGAPFWSAGLSWNLSQESFYHFSLIPELKLRVTYGYQGNTNNKLSAYSTIRYANTNDFIINLPYADLINPANDQLRWERVSNFNLGVDFNTKNNVLSGSVEYYSRSAKDVLNTTPLDYTTGFSNATYNSSALKGSGVDITLHSNILNGNVKWNADLFFNYNRNEVTKYTPISNEIGNYLGSVLSIPGTLMVGRPVLSVFSYKWAGLDPQTGDPIGYLNGEKSKDYKLLTSVGPDQLRYNGSAVPIYSGAIRNTFTYKNIAVSANIVAKFGYVFRRNSINYDALLSGASRNPVVGHGDYALRWQKPGDEKFTNVPSFIYPNNSLREQFYTGSEALVAKADHVRLQDVTVSYMVNKLGSAFRNLKIFANASNLGIIWKANKLGLDPDSYSSYPVPKTIAVGMNANF